VPEEVKARASTDTKGESSLRGHLKAEGDEQAGSQSYVPPETKDDKALNAAFELLRGGPHRCVLPAQPERRRAELKLGFTHGFLPTMIRGRPQRPPAFF